MAKLEEARTKRTADAGAQEAVFGTALTTLDPLLQASNRLLEDCRTLFWFGLMPILMKPRKTSSNQCRIYDILWLQ